MPDPNRHRDPHLLRQATEEEQRASLLDRLAGGMRERLEAGQAVEVGSPDGPIHGILMSRPSAEALRRARAANAARRALELDRAIETANDDTGATDPSYRAGVRQRARVELVEVILRETLEDLASISVITDLQVGAGMFQARAAGKLIHVTLEVVKERS